MKRWYPGDCPLPAGWLAILATVFVVAALAQQGGKIDSCGYRGNIHDCHCSTRVEKIRELDVTTCITKVGTKEYDACVKNALAGHDHCAIAERQTPWDIEGGEYGPAPHGDNAKSKMGEYCKHSCAPHHCACTEQACDFH